MNIKITGIGSYLPTRIVTGEEVDRVINKPIGWTNDYVGVKERRYANEKETVSYMAKEAILKALDMAGLKLSEIDAICYAGASGEQVIPSTACLIQRQLGLEKSGISCFDINSTCLSFVTSLDTLSYMVDAGRYKNVVIVASEIASCAINPKEPESYALFGDGAVAITISKTPKNETSKILKALHETYSEGADFCRVVGGASKIPPNLKTVTKETEDLFKFEMKGREVFKQSIKLIPDFTNRLLENTNLSLKDIDMVCPHQASKSAMKLIRRKLKIDEDKFMTIVEDRGNMISASIPMALYVAIEEGRIKRGDTIMLIGTSAGLSLGGMVLEF